LSAARAARRGLGLGGEGGILLDGHDRLGHARDHRRRIAVSAADVEHEVLGRHGQRVEHLGEGARVEQHPARGERHVLAEIGHRLQRLGHEFLARNVQQSGDDGIARHVRRPDLTVHHGFACRREINHPASPCARRGGSVMAYFR
jgi:hypothetical protein